MEETLSKSKVNNKIILAKRYFNFEEPINVWWKNNPNYIIKFLDAVEPTTFRLSDGGSND